MSDLNHIIQKLSKISPLSDGLVDELHQHVSFKDYEKGDFILKEGKTSNYTVWVMKGLIRSFYLRDGEEITTKFLWEDAVVRSVYSYYSRKPGNENFVALEPTILALLHRDQIDRLYARYPEFNTIGRVMTEHWLYMSEVELYNLRKQKAEDRYRFILKHFPHLLQRVSLTHLASYLGVNLETLSRIRAKLK